MGTALRLTRLFLGGRSPFCLVGEEQVPCPNTAAASLLDTHCHAWRRATPTAQDRVEVDSVNADNIGKARLLAVL